jgi:O-antigen ligase
MAAFGIVQLLAGNGKFFWFYRHPFTVASTVAKGSFSNRNHFAHFLALGIGPLIWWLQDAWRRTRSRGGAAASSLGRHVHGRAAESKTYLLGLTLGVVLFAGLLSLSRGGIAAMFLAVMVATAICYWASAVGGRLVVSLAAVGLLLGGVLSISGLDYVSNRLEDFSSGSIERLDAQAGRRIIWAAAANAVPDHLLLGSGVGSFRDVYPMHTDAVRDENIEYAHAENSPLQVAVEMGMPGIALVLAGIILIAYWCFRGSGSAASTRSRVCAAAIAATMAASLAHALVDFVWYVPACMAIVAILAACALRVSQLSRAKEPQLSRVKESPRMGRALAAHPHPSSPTRLNNCRVPRLACPTVSSALLDKPGTDRRLVVAPNSTSWQVGTPTFPHTASYGVGRCQQASVLRGKRLSRPGPSAPRAAGRAIRDRR